MPQFDFSSFFAQLFWVLFFLILFYFYISFYYLPITGYYLKTRKNFFKKGRKVYVPQLVSSSVSYKKYTTNKKLFF